MDEQRRKSTRRHALYNVLLYHNNYPVKTCIVLNKSHGGLYLETGPAIFPVDMSLEIGFDVTVKGRPMRYRLPVKVIHCNKKGMGLAFIDTTNSEHIFAKRLLHLASTVSYELRNIEATLNVHKLT